MEQNKEKFKLLIMMVVSLATQIVSLLKTSVVAGTFGASFEMDAYIFASSMVSFVFGFVASSVSTIIIPEYANSRGKHSVNTFITVIYGFLAVIVLLIILLRYQISWLFSNREEIFINLVAEFLVVLLLSQYLASISNITIAYFQCKQKYILPQIINLCCQLVVVLFLFFLKNITIYQYAIIISMGMIFNFILDIYGALKTGWRFNPTFLIDDESKVLFKRFIPIIFSTGVYRLTLMVDSTLAASLDEGKITIISYASQISVMANTVIVGTILTYIYPKIAKDINNSGYQDEFWKITFALHSIVCLIISGFISVGYEGVTLLFQHGLFLPEATKLLFVVAALYIFDQQTNVIRDLIYRYFYAYGITKVPATNSVVISILNLVLSIVLVNYIGFFGIIVGTMISSLISLIIILCRFKKIVGLSQKLYVIIIKYFMNIGIMVLTVVVVLLTKSTGLITNGLISIFVYGIETVVIYAGLTFILNKEVIVTLKNI